MLQEDINHIKTRGDKNRMQLNVRKYNQSIVRPTYYNGGHIVVEVDRMRDLGIILDSKLNYVAHCEYITAFNRPLNAGICKKKY